MRIIDHIQSDCSQNMTNTYLSLSTLHSLATSPLRYNSCSERCGTRRPGISGIRCIHVVAIRVPRAYIERAVEGELKSRISESSFKFSRFRRIGPIAARVKEAVLYLKTTQDIQLQAKQERETIHKDSYNSETGSVSNNSTAKRKKNKTRTANN